ncbi:hypothetical protein [Virgisporangium aurantiacum]|uniref:Uncharacterized protein n=1 Tax=Virgisporangium aurantiacum TaxID=175570 RepID=A0A8J3ZFV1_9ACTN|nr:hypothetical protein [Virgisporangium aurantiacum]GIJ62028.1 hypothetical protein Vau01_095440 [Virgisporangium aurantiacum]
MSSGASTNPAAGNAAGAGRWRAVGTQLTQLTQPAGRQPATQLGPWRTQPRRSAGIRNAVRMIAGWLG